MPSPSPLSAARPRAVLFDLDDTLLDAYANPRETWLRLLAGFEGRLGGVDLPDVMAAIVAAGQPFWADAQRAARWRLDIRGARRIVVREAFAQLGVAAQAGGHALADEIADAFTALRRAEYRMFPEAIAVLNALRAEGIRLALITNGAADIQREKVERFGLAAHFDHIQIEGEFGRGKPEPEVYVHALAVLGCAPRETWMVGDNLEWDVLAPQRQGITGIWYDPRRLGLEGHMHTGVHRPMPDAKPDRIIHALNELLG